MRDKGRMRETAAIGAIGSLPGASRGYLPLLPTACVAICLAAGSLYWREPEARAPEGQVVAMQPLPPGADLFRGAPEGDGRVRAPYPLEFERQFPLVATLPPEAAMPVLPVIAEAKAVESKVEDKPEGKAPRRLAAPHRTRAVPALAGLRPPARPEMPRAGKTQPETAVESGRMPATRTASTDSETGRSSPWLPFMPTGRVVTQTVAAVGDGVVNAGAAMIDLIDRRR
ncbi:hypothetical protein QR79_31125 [Methylobacterium indicum]|uniref:Uncharacterized protein n=2 Tax=Methylobacterium indicum TaxID=1775910 RepID=A0ABR5GNT2_9HYPH|nr:hypothetical protein [Methylobacterium indicum]KMO10368.1 hypothetical protein QR79_31125 [Methylobacterium indicum]